MPETTTGDLFAKALTTVVDSMDPYPARLELVFSGRGVPMAKVVESLPELNRAAILKGVSSFGLQQEMLLSMQWTGILGGGGLVVIDAITLPDGRHVFVQFGALDFHDQLAECEIHQVIAASTVGCENDGKNVFLEELIRTNGEAFGIALLSSAPGTLSCAYSGSRENLVDVFVECFNASVKCGTEPLESLENHVELETDDDEGYNLRATVASYLNQLLAHRTPRSVGFRQVLNAGKVSISSSRQSASFPRFATPSPRRG